MESLNREHRERIERLFVRYGEGVGSYVAARVGDPELAEEITANVFLTVVRKYHQCRGSEAGWLWTIVRTEMARLFRDRRPLARIETDPPSLAEAPPDLAARLETQESMRQALAELSEDEQQVVHMKFFLDMGNREIAEATGLTPSNVGVIVFRSLKRLRGLMGPRGAADSGPRTGRAAGRSEP